VLMHHQIQIWHHTALRPVWQMRRCLYSSLSPVLGALLLWKVLHLVLISREVLATAETTTSREATAGVVELSGCHKLRRLG